MTLSWISSFFVLAALLVACREASNTAPSAGADAGAKPAPTNCGQHPEQRGCNCFTSHPNSTCFDP